MGTSTHSSTEDYEGGDGVSPAAEEHGPGLVLHYRIPDYLEGQIEPGQLVAVTLRGRPTYGLVTELDTSSPVETTHPITGLVDARPLVLPHMLALARWIADYYNCTLWQALAPMLPPGVARKAITRVGLTDDASIPEDGKIDPLIAALGHRQQEVVSLLQSAPSSTLSLSRLKRQYGGPTSGLESALRSLERSGLVSRHTELPNAKGKTQQEKVLRLGITSDEARTSIHECAERAPLQAAALTWLLSREKGLSAQQEDPENDTQSSSSPHDSHSWQRLRDLYLHTGATWATVAALKRKGWVDIEERPIERKPVPLNAAAMNDEPPTLTSAQATALREISEALQTLREPATDEQAALRDRGAVRPFLLHGVTGSGKTEIYLRAIGMALRMKRQAIVLVPEISLTPQAVHRFASRFPGRVALVHSQLPPSQQFDEWQRIRGGQADIVIGSRSAVFAPLPRLGLVIVDEEHEWAYKQDHTPRYHARDVALKRAELSGSVAILGSATPDLVSYYRAQKGDYRLLSLPARVGRRKAANGTELIAELPMPHVQVVDMRAELRAGNPSVFSRSLQSALSDTLARKEQAILYLNRRGSNSFILCRSCGHVPLCERCDVPMVYHADVYGMLCHRCNDSAPVPRYCPKCGGEIKGFGVGTQRVVDEVAALFPRARVLRWDKDTASRHGGHAGIMDMFTNGEADILVGTQMIAKGLDIARVTLVGVVSADTGLFLPDFRAPERSVQLLMQVAGRAGRRANTTHSRAIVQTFNPDHYSIQAAARHDYRGFYKGEIRFRAEHAYPPYGQLARLVYQSPSDERCEQAAHMMARYLRRRIELLRDEGILDEMDAGEADVIGPAPCFVHKVRGRYRWQIMIRAGNVHPVFEGLDPGPGWSLDIDPLNLL